MEGIRAQALRALSPGCLPCSFPRRETSTLAAHVALSVVSSGSGILTTNLRFSSIDEVAGAS